MNRVKLYDIHGSSTISNYKTLITNDKKYFYWDSKKFLKYELGEFVFWINREQNEALFTSVDNKEIKPNFKDGRNFINDLGYELSALAQNAYTFELFYRFKIIERKTIPDSWSYKSPKPFNGQTMAIILFEEKVDEPPKKIEKIHDLLKIFDKGQAFEILNKALKLLKGEPILNEIIKKAIDSTDVQNIINDDKFYYEKAKLQLDKFKLLNNTSNFYTDILEKYEKTIGITFEQFVDIQNKESDEYVFLLEMGKLIALIDSKASGKAKWNEYPDKRTVAHSGVRQGDWVRNLIQYKINGNSSSAMSPSISNSISFLEDPFKGINMLSENHKQLVAKNLLKTEYSPDSFVNKLYDFFKPYQISNKTPENLNAIFSRILYQPEVKQIWNLSDIPPGSEEPKSIKEVVSRIHEYISNSGFKYHYEEIANFYLSLKTKPFIILAGISGSGKTQLPRKFAEAIGMQKDLQLTQIPVRPDWTDGSELLGYTSLNGRFIPKDLTLAINKAKNNNSKPHFFILDEMNLARVEHYFSDFLSVIETRTWIDTEKSDIITDPILRKELLHNAENNEEYENLTWPKNLYLIGTVNMDETTHTFSRKVLDRANTIEMNDVDLDWLKYVEKTHPQINISNLFLESEFLGSIDLTEDEKTSIESEMKLLIKINDILRIADLHFAYRIRDEVAFYLLSNKKFEILDPRVAMDFQIVQKVLPRIHGSSERVQKVLIELLNLLENTAFISDNIDFNKLDALIKANKFKYKRSTKKILYMLMRFEDDRFTSFWI